MKAAMSLLVKALELLSMELIWTLATLNMARMQQQLKSNRLRSKSKRQVHMATKKILKAKVRWCKMQILRLKLVKVLPSSSTERKEVR